ncbi:piggyBac transposable element-derived protein 2-like [Corythoichthys intestinalis]|uniref:piggyBac transposable element-derived protein 2-like n=1 Tax=Corythoichthys intestinalis TaxID=161448 RepID=UPI0025A53BD8|nr:piggyBac transposable element-derived protein 2-like [Corythoichthys intestinalis]
MQKNKCYSVQDALKIIMGDDSEFEGCDDSSDEDPDDPLYNPTKQDMESDESSQCYDSDNSELSTSDDVQQPNVDLHPQNRSNLGKKQETEGTVQGRKHLSWRSKPFETPECTFKGPHITPPDTLLSPLEYFRKFITTEMLELLKEQTNLYSVQKSEKHNNVNTTVKELEIMIGLYLRMGLCQLTGNRAYWENDTRCPMIADVMSRNRFQNLLVNLHFTDNTDVSSRQAKDKCWKIRPWLDMFRKQCLDITPEEHNSIDEQMVSFRGTHSPIRQYVKGKPHPWGFKIWSRCSSSGILYDFTVYEGGSGKKSSLGMGGDVVVKLCETLPSDRNYKVFADNLFSSAPLVLNLLQRKIYFVGTLRGNRLAGCQLEDEKSLAKTGRGSVDARVEKEERLAIVKWYDNKSVTLISSYCAVEPQDTVRRWSKADKKFLEVRRPHIVREYNTFVGGVDLLDGCIARCKYHMRSRRWYLYLFWHTIMLGLVNAWLIYRRDCKLLGVKNTLRQKSFQAEVATSLILTQARRGRPSLSEASPSPPPPPKRVRVGVPDDVRSDQVAHWPLKCEKRGRCKLCKVHATTTLCEKCDVRLCFTEERNCFKTYHLA